MIPSDRMITLLKKAANTFDDCSSPFETEWLVVNDVKFDECMSMSEQIAWAIRLYLTIADKLTSTGDLANLDKRLGALIYADVIRMFFSDEAVAEAEEDKSDREKALDEMVRQNQAMGLYD